jgi:hypothetical protein
MTESPITTKTSWLSKFTGYLADMAARFALRRFDADRQAHQQTFLRTAQATGKPRGLTWSQCDWMSERVLLRDATTNVLTLLVGLNVRFEAEAGGDMEDVDAVSMVRDAAAVFHFRDGQWGTGGRVLFNHSPTLAASRMESAWITVATAPASPAT